MRWRAFFFLKKDSDTEESSDSDDESQTTEMYGFKSKRTPPKIDEMVDFENDMLALVDNIEFRNTNDKFQSKLRTDVQHINKSDQIIVEADKTRNVYKMDAADYTKLLNEDITQKYKIAEQKTVNDITIEFHTTAERLNVSDRINNTTPKPAFITLKDHKENFSTNPKRRLINPTKTEISQATKVM